MAPNRRQTITWTNSDPVHRRIDAALGGMSWIYVELNDLAFDNFTNTIHSYHPINTKFGTKLCIAKSYNTIENDFWIDNLVMEKLIYFEFEW